MTTLNQAIEQYLQRGFGSMNKNDFEVFLFSQILEFPQYKGKSNYDLSLSLHIPETKIKRLRYEAALKKSVNVEDFKNNVRSLLENAQLRGGDKKIMFQVEDIMLKMYISSILKRQGRMIDHSFNDEVVVIRIEDYEYLLKDVYPKEEIKKHLKRAQNSLGKDVTWANILEWTIEGLANGAINGVSSNMVNLTITGITKIIPQLITFLKK